MKKTLFTLPILIVFLVYGCSISDEENTNNDQTVHIDQKLVPPTSKLKAVDCAPDQRNIDACIEIYQPVCGYVQVQCIKAPCDPVHETFANSCKACSNPLVLSYTEGECFSSEDIKR